MEDTELLRTENVENQQNSAISGASQEAQLTVSDAVAPEASPAVIEPEKQQNDAQTSVVADMMSEIETQTAAATEAAEAAAEVDVEVEESLDQIEKEYENLSPEEAVEELHRVVANPNYAKIKQRVGVLKVKILNSLKEKRKAMLEKFLQEGGNKDDFKPETSDFELKYNEALHTFKVNKERFLANIEQEKQRNLEAKQAIIKALQTLVESETNLKVLNDKFKELQDQWKAIGHVPQTESATLWQNYHFYVEKFFDILRINKELKLLDLQKNMESKIKLCEAAESLLLQDSVNKAFSELQHLHNEWKEIGPVPEEKKEELWERFKNASDQINQRRREYYEQMFAEQQNNYNAKVVLCEKAEEFTAQPMETAKDYNTISDQLTELLKVWKTLGIAPPKVNEEIWLRFKGSLDKFFEKKKVFFNQMKDEQQNNYNKKVNLAIQAEAIAKRTDWRTATDDIIRLQKEWKEIGATTRKHSEAIWKRFRSACDQFFEAKANYFNNAQEIEAENLKKKEALVQKILEHQFGEDKNANLEAIKTYQREWTEIGFVPKKDKDRIYASYREALNKRFADLKMSMEEVRHNSYRNHLDSLLQDPNADKLLDKEKRILVNKLNQLKEEIAIWENNLGFFANSKNADLLKDEFTKKIEAAKEEVKDLEYKIKMMNKPKEN